MTGRVLSWVQTRRLHFTAVELREHFSSLSQANANQILHRLAKSGDVLKVAYGVYRRRE